MSFKESNIKSVGSPARPAPDFNTVFDYIHQRNPHILEMPLRTAV